MSDFDALHLFFDVVFVAFALYLLHLHTETKIRFDKRIGRLEALNPEVFVAPSVEPVVGPKSLRTTKRKIVN
jgi:hypothetical protein